MKMTSPKKWRWIQFYPKKEEELTQKINVTSPKYEEDLTQKWRQPHPKMKITSPKNEDDLTQKWGKPTPKNEDNLSQKFKTIYPKLWQNKLRLDFRVYHIFFEILSQPGYFSDFHDQWLIWKLIAKTKRQSNNITVLWKEKNEEMAV